MSIFQKSVFFRESQARIQKRRFFFGDLKGIPYWILTILHVFESCPTWQKSCENTVYCSQGERYWGQKEHHTSSANITRQEDSPFMLIFSGVLKCERPSWLPWRRRRIDSVWASQLSTMAGTIQWIRISPRRALLPTRNFPEGKLIFNSCSSSWLTRITPTKPLFQAKLTKLRIPL